MAVARSRRPRAPWNLSGGGRRLFASSVQPVDPQRELAAAGLERGAVDADDVAEVEAEQRVELLVAEHVGARVELDPAGAVDEVEERRLAVAAPRGDPAGDPVGGVGLLAGVEALVRGAHAAISVAAVEVVRERARPRPRAGARASRAARRARAARALLGVVCSRLGHARRA